MKAILKVGGMHCQSCSMLIESELKDFDGINNVKVLLEKGTVEIDFDDSQIYEDTIKEVIERSGYKVQ
jgi:copper chaperone